MIYLQADLFHSDLDYSVLLSSQTLRKKGFNGCDSPEPDGEDSIDQSPLNDDKYRKTTEDLDVLFKRYGVSGWSRSIWTQRKFKHQVLIAADRPMARDVVRVKQKTILPAQQQSTAQPQTFTMPVTVQSSNQSTLQFSNPGNALVTTSDVTSSPLADAHLLSPQQPALQRNTVSPGLPQRPASAGESERARERERES